MECHHVLRLYLEHGEPFPSTLPWDQGHGPQHRHHPEKHLPNTPYPADIPPATDGVLDSESQARERCACSKSAENRPVVAQADVNFRECGTRTQPGCCRARASVTARAMRTSPSAFGCTPSGCMRSGRECSGSPILST